MEAIRVKSVAYLATICQYCQGQYSRVLPPKGIPATPSMHSESAGFLALSIPSGGGSKFMWGQARVVVLYTQQCCLGHWVR